MKELEQKLLDRDVKPTALRLLIFKAMVEYPQAFSLSDLEVVLETVDKSTISRTITLFHDHLVIHSIDDGSGSIKYSVCNDDCQCTLNELHVHFRLRDIQLNFAV
jgi:Fur family ferric uptake transcriptional regulator